MAPWKRWYKTARWQALRARIFLRDLFTCRKCGSGTQLVCDHIKPHRGNEALFWDEANLQTLCKACHDRDKQREEQQSRQTQGVWY